MVETLATGQPCSRFVLEEVPNTVHEREGDGGEVRFYWEERVDVFGLGLDTPLNYGLEDKQSGKRTLRNAKPLEAAI
jgi:hypothetical protein